MIDDEDIDRASLGLQPETKLFLERREDGGSEVLTLIGRPLQVDIELTHGSGAVDNGTAENAACQLCREHFHRYLAGNQPCPLPPLTSGPWPVDGASFRPSFAIRSAKTGISLDSR